jgi:hypothetical protein
LSSRAVSDWLASLPRDREFSIHQAYETLLKDHPKQAPTKARASMAITKSGLFDTWMDGRARMFRRKGAKQ